MSRVPSDFTGSSVQTSNLFCSCNHSTFIIEFYIYISYISESIRPLNLFTTPSKSKKILNNLVNFVRMPLRSVLLKDQW